MEDEEREKAMIATDDMEIAHDTTPPLPPLTFSLYDSSLSSHCSACFCSLSSSSSSSSSTTTTTSSTATFFRYCSNGVCSSTSTSSSAEYRLLLLLLSFPSLFPDSDSSDLRAALRLLHHHRHLLSQPSPRLFGLLTNRRKLMVNEEVAARVRDGAKVMAMALRDGKKEEGEGRECELIEAVLCLVITNGVEISVNSKGPVGIGVYDWRFSWINHSCAPNLCYRFVSAFEVDDDSMANDHAMRIVPSGSRETDEMEDFSAHTTCELAKGHGNCGPRLVVRSIKTIQRGEEVTIAYTDLLQPTTLRQSELLLKFQFICACRRCSSVPQAYVDYALEETFFTYCRDNSVSSIIDDCKEKIVERLRDALDSTIMEYVEVGDPVSCCEKIEGLLSQGLFIQHLEDTGQVPRMDLRLSPVHHLSLNAYTTLSSTYKIRANQSVDGKQLHGFGMSRISAAYSLLLAGATHHLFLSEPSFVSSAATFWTNAGESLLHLARSSSWNLFANCVLQYDLSVLNLNCTRCLLMDKFESKFCSYQTESREFDGLSREFLMCVSIMTPKVWSFLVGGSEYLKHVKDPIDFSWLGCMRSSRMWDPDARTPHHRFNLGFKGGVEENLLKCDGGEQATEMRSDIFQLGVHCMLYGGYLSCICYGHQQYRANWMKNLLCR